MIPILSSDEMRECDARAVAVRGSDALVEAAGLAVALHAQRMMGSCYARRVAVIAGPGLNGADGRVAAKWLRRRGARVVVIDVGSEPDVLDGYHLVIDAAFGLGCTRSYNAPAVSHGTKVLAVDLPSGVDADTGVVFGHPLRADATVALGAIKYALLTGPAATYAGVLRFDGLGIVSEFRDGLVEDGDLNDYVRGDSRDHKWRHAVQVFAGSPAMPGAAALVTRGALSGGASMVRLESHGLLDGAVELPVEIVRTSTGSVDPRCRAVIAGPGVGEGAEAWLGERLAGVAAPVVLDADGLVAALIPHDRTVTAKWIVTPHDGEFQRLAGSNVPDDRIAAVRSLAAATGCNVLLKGPTTLLASPDGVLRAVTSGTAALATAGSGDVLAGLIGAAIARGHGVLTAGALSAHLHGRAGANLSAYDGASSLLASVTAILDDVRSSPSSNSKVARPTVRGERG